MTEPSLYGLRDRLVPHLDRAVAQVHLPLERLMWETTGGLVPNMQMTPEGPKLGGAMHMWLMLTCPSPILGEGAIVTAAVADLPRMADDYDEALRVVRSLAENLRGAVANKLKSGTNGAS